MTEPQPSVEFVRDEPPPPPAAYPPRPLVATTARPNVGAGIGVLGLGLALVSVFGLPVEDYANVQTVTYGNFHEIATEFGGQGADLFFGGPAKVWWQFGALVAAGVLVLLVAAVAVRAHAVLGWAITVIAVAVGVLHAVSLGQTGDYIAVQRNFRPGPSVYDHPGIGIWLSYVGFGILAAGGLVSALTSRTRRAVPPPIH